MSHSETGCGNLMCFLRIGEGVAKSHNVGVEDFNARVGCILHRRDMAGHEFDDVLGLRQRK